MNCELKLLSSQEKVFFKNPSDMLEHVRGSMLKNEIYSFQLAVFCRDADNQRVFCKIKVESELQPYISIKQVGYVPVLVPSVRINDDDDYITKDPGLFPDPLHSVKDGETELANEQTRTFWIAVEPGGEKTGTYPIVLQILDYENRILAETCFTLEIIDAELPETEVRNTAWFHGDCLAALHNVEMQSEAYYEILEKYLAVYAKFGHNMILTPIFTPALDTAVGGERPTNQLVDIVWEHGRYSFDFTKLKRWIDLCHKYGIRFFEMAHLFTQWGAEHAPKIMAVVDGAYRKIFGWETDALSDEYRDFLGAFLPELVDFLKKEGIMENCYFHVSDEPRPRHEQQYRAVKEMVLPYVPEEQWIDALSDYSFYEKGIVSRPIVSNNHIHTFLENEVPNLWTYYCVSQRKDVANRFIAMPSYRHRILGYQLYKYHIQGFLHWGFDFWFSQLSKKVLNPYIDTTSGGAFSSGDGFVVYPLDEDGEVVCSLRLYVLNESWQDLRALELLESLTDRETVTALLKDVEGFDSYPRDSRYLINLREEINRRIKQQTALEGE